MKNERSFIPFIKMQGLGNDFILIDSLIAGEHKAGMPPFSLLINASLAQQLCHRRFGIGADQILWLKSPQDLRLDARMEVFNADGSIAEMCGNGIRAVGVYLAHLHCPSSSLVTHSNKFQKTFQIETSVGAKEVQVELDLTRGGGQARVDMGIPHLGRGFSYSNLDLLSNSFRGQSLEGLPEVGEIDYFEVSMGNPHVVIFLPQPSSSGSQSRGEYHLQNFPIEKIGPLIETHPHFPNRTNVEFVQMINPHQMQVKVWERGAGLTLACGTGACAAATAAIATGRAKTPVQVQLPGGSLEISWEGKLNPLWMKGPAQEVFRGFYYL